MNSFMKALLAPASMESGKIKGLGRIVKRQTTMFFRSIDILLKGEPVSYVFTTFSFLETLRDIEDLHRYQVVSSRERKHIVLELVQTSRSRLVQTPRLRLEASLHLCKEKKSRS